MLTSCGRARESYASATYQFLQLFGYRAAETADRLRTEPVNQSGDPFAEGCDQPSLFPFRNSYNR
ncbi:MAG: hypothetical protein DMG70_31015 [Acidobacteria bacterium]|nr:MAG: hypothetical protein DMG70_31015 [Acidobacteriota bacterium]PYY12201.1 MAG: hypothetical protein DMG69_02060 [Acidobacteriota bacterium]